MGIPEPPFSPVSSRCLLSVCFTPNIDTTGESPLEDGQGKADGYDRGGSIKESIVLERRRKSMSLHPQMLVPVPEETARVARTAYPKGNLYLQIRDELGTIYEDRFCTFVSQLRTASRSSLALVAGVSDAICRRTL